MRAPWIVGQVAEQFGGLIDFYHVCEYLSAVATAIAGDAAAREAWIETQKAALKTGRLDAVLQALAAHGEAPEVEDGQAPVRNCHRYLSRRRAQLDYPRALADGLPIGSGETESAHRYLAQQRLKRPGGPGGASRTRSTCLRCASCGSTATGRPIGGTSREMTPPTTILPKEQDGASHERSTLDHTPWIANLRFVPYYYPRGFRFRTSALGHCNCPWNKRQWLCTADAYGRRQDGRYGR